MHFRFEQRIELPRATVFTFHEDPGHLVLVHRGWSAFRMIHHEPRLRQGARTWVEITFAGIVPVALGFEHTLYEPPCRFGEQLIHGPFQRFTHVHEFEEAEAGTILRDLLEIELPWFYGGEWAMRFILAPMVRRAFQFRQAALLKLAQSGDIAARAQRHVAGDS